MSFYKYTFISVSIYKHIHIKPWVLILPYFFNYKMHSPPKTWEENGGASYSPNVAYLAHCDGGGGWQHGSGARVFFFPILLL